MATTLAKLFPKAKDAKLFATLRSLIDQHLDAIAGEGAKTPSLTWTHRTEPDVILLSMHERLGHPNLIFHAVDQLEKLPAWKALAPWVKFRNCLVFAKPPAKIPDDLRVVLEALPGAFDILIGKATKKPAAKKPAKKSATKKAR